MTWTSSDRASKTIGIVVVATLLFGSLPAQATTPAPVAPIQKLPEGVIPKNVPGKNNALPLPGITQLEFLSLRREQPSEEERLRLNDRTATVPELVATAWGKVEADKSEVLASPVTMMRKSLWRDDVDVANASLKARRYAKRHFQQTFQDTPVDQSNYACLYMLFFRESRWNYKVKNPTSDAYGIAQALPPTKYETVGDDWRTNPLTQTEWGIQYVEDRYGDPCQALKSWHSRAPNWY